MQIIRDTASRMTALEGISFSAARYMARQKVHTSLGSAVCMADFRIHRAAAPLGSASVPVRQDTERQQPPSRIRCTSSQATA
eukprot:2868748-Amphidinium_carterae.1